MRFNGSGPRGNLGLVITVIGLSGLRPLEKLARTSQIEFAESPSDNRTLHRLRRPPEGEPTNSEEFWRHSDEALIESCLFTDGFRIDGALLNGEF